MHRASTRRPLFGRSTADGGRTKQQRTNPCHASTTAAAHERWRGSAAPGFGFGLACPLQRQRPVYVYSEGLARHALWRHLLQCWLACCKPGQTLQACCKQAKAAIDGTTMCVWPVPLFSIMENKQGIISTVVMNKLQSQNLPPVWHLIIRKITNIKIKCFHYVLHRSPPPVGCWGNQ